MRNVFLGLILLLAPLSMQAQKWPFELWHEGKIVLVAGDTLKGLVKYNLQQDLVQFSTSSQIIEAFTARKILFFEIFDITVHKYRQFYALPFRTTNGYEAPVFFELLSEGKMTLLSREALEYQTYSSPYYIGGYSRQVLVNKFFLIDDKGGIEQFTGNKNDLLKLMGKRSDDVGDYIKSNKLNVADKYDFAQIVQYYNSFFHT